MTSGAREDAADAAEDAGVRRAVGDVTDVVVHSTINWNVGNPDGDENTATDDNNLKSNDTGDVTLLTLPKSD